jgi:predicted DNA-binding protein with PD1-like motif
LTLGVHRSDKSRHLLLRIPAGTVVPDTLAAALRDEGITCGWLRGSGVLSDVELRAYDGDIGTLGSARRVAGPVQAISLEGSIGLAGGETSLSLRAVLAREADRGLETLAGEIGSARVVALEVFVTVLEDLRVERVLDESAGVWLLGGAAGETASLARTPPQRPPAAVRAGWSNALEASDRSDREPGRTAASPSLTGPAIPARPPRGVEPDLDTPFPEPGDSVDHFAFGRSDVLKSDGDRLHLKVHKDGRVREIALGMLRVSRLPDSDDGRRRFRLERRM